MEQPLARLGATVFGVVQGVNFRYATRLTAQRLGLTGWVRNLPTGAVEVLAEGPAAALHALLEFLHHGPPHAQVDRVQTDWPPATGEFTRFDIRY